MACILEARNLNKSFGAVTAAADINNMVTPSIIRVPAIARPASTTVGIRGH